MATPANAEPAANVPVLLRKSRREVEGFSADCLLAPALMAFFASLIISVVLKRSLKSIDSAIHRFGNFCYLLPSLNTEPTRCPWPNTPLYIAYHDTEWGVPNHDDRHLFEMLILEGAQAGLSWSTILNKRENYRLAFDKFDAEKIARYDRRKVAKLLANPGIVRNKLKVAAAIQNAKAFLAVRDEFGTFDNYIWQFVGGAPR